jgi:hypothetical protein
MKIRVALVRLSEVHWVHTVDGVFLRHPPIVTFAVMLQGLKVVVNIW